MDLIAVVMKDMTECNVKLVSTGIDSSLLKLLVDHSCLCNFMPNKLILRVANIVFQKFWKLCVTASHRPAQAQEEPVE